MRGPKRQQKKRKGSPPHEHRWILETYRNGLYYYKYFCGATVTTNRPIK